MKIIWLGLCCLLFSTWNASGQMIINEIQPDAGNYEGNGGDWIELKNPGSSAVDMSCWKLSNGGSFNVQFPSGLVVPPGAYLLIGRASRMACATCDFRSLSNLFSFGSSGYGPGSGVYSNTIFLNTDSLSLGGCGCLEGTGNFNNGTGTGDRIVLFSELGNVVDAFQYAGGDFYGTTALTVNFSSLGSCLLGSVTIPAPGDVVYQGRTVCNDLGGCNSSYARLPDANNGTTVTYDQSGNLSCSTCLFPCGSGATNTAGTDFPTPGLNNALSAATWSATLNGIPVSSPVTNITVCGATPLTFTYTIQRYTNASLVANQGSGLLGSYVSVNGAAPVNFTGTNYNPSTGISILSASLIPGSGTTTYDLVWGDGNTQCSTCPGSSSLGTPGNPLSSESECFVSRKVIVQREDLLGGTPTASCTIPGTVTISNASGTNLRYTLQKQTSSGGPFNTLLGPQTSPIIAGIIDDDADPNLPNYRVLVSSVNTVCANPTPLIVNIPAACMGNPACARYATSGPGAPLFFPANGSTVCAGAPIQFTVSITGVCTNGQVEMYYDHDPLFDPYVQGTLLGVSGTSVGATPPSTTATGRVFINEFVVRPAQGTCPGPTTPDGLNPNSGEWVELYNAGPGFVDISGWILADGDWTATIPAGTILNANAFYLIGGGGTFCSSGVLPDLNIETCNCATLFPAPPAADIMNLTNNGEQLALFDCTGNFIDGVLWGSGQAIPDTTANTAPAAGCGNYILQKNVNLPANTSYASSGTIPSPNSGKYRTSTNTWTTTTSVMITPKASNPGGEWNGGSTPFGTQCPPPPVSASLTVNLPDTCFAGGNTAITVKAIYKPNPVSPCTETEVTAAASYIIPPCETLTLSGTGDYCAPAIAPITLTTSGLLSGNHTVFLGNGTQTQVVGPLNGAGPFTGSVGQSGVWIIDSVQAPSGTCPPKRAGQAQVQIFPIPEIVSAPSSASFCYLYGFDLSTLESSIVSNPPTLYYNWYDSASGGTPISPFVNPAVPTTYYVAPNTGLPVFCEGSLRTPVLLNIQSLPEIPAVICDGITTTFIPMSPNCQPSLCTSPLQYSANGIDWGLGPVFTAADPGWSGFGSPTNSMVYIRNSATPSCVAFAAFFSPCAVPLPASLTAFHAQWLGTSREVQLSWNTHHEINMEAYAIERSPDGISFLEIQRVAARNRHLDEESYLDFDKQPLPGTSYYRLRMMDQDGQYTYSPIVEVMTDRYLQQLQIYPNPVNEETRISLFLTQESPVSFRLYNALGQQVQAFERYGQIGQQNIPMNLEFLPSGRYILQAITPTETLTQSLLKP